MSDKMETSSLDNSFESKIKKEKEESRAIVKKEDVVIKKKTLGQKFKDAFISSDMSDVSDYILLDIIVPGIQNAIIDTLERIFSSGRSYDRRDRRDSRYGRTSYTSYYRSDDRDRRKKRRDRYDDDDDREPEVDYRRIIVKRREDAEQIVDRLRDEIREYDKTTVASLLESVEYTGDFTDNSWGWTSPSDIGVKRVRDGYLIDVREARYLGD